MVPIKQTLPACERRYTPYHLLVSIIGYWSSYFIVSSKNLARNESQFNLASQIQGLITRDMGSPETEAGDIVICSMATRSLGGSRDAEIFWDGLCNGNNMKGSIAANHHIAKKLESSFSQNGVILIEHLSSDDLSYLNTALSSTPMAEPKEIDPQQRQILEVTGECLEKAGEVDYRDELIGCYVGTFGEHELRSGPEDSQQHRKDSVSGDLRIANRTSFELDLKGPSMVIRTGCAASLASLHEACCALRDRDCDGATIIGTSLLQTMPRTGTRRCSNTADGLSQIHDAKVNNFRSDEAVNVIFIKRLDDALRDMSPVHAIIRATRIDNNGSDPCLLAPDNKSYGACMNTVHADTKLNPQ